PLPPLSPPFPYTTLFRSFQEIGDCCPALPPRPEARDSGIPNDAPRFKRANLAQPDTLTIWHSRSPPAAWLLTSRSNRIATTPTQDRKSTRLNSSHLVISY